MTPPEGLTKIANHNISRNKAAWFALGVGAAIGVVNAWLEVDLTPSFELLGWVAAAIVLTVVAHEGTHGLAARLLGYKPIFGLKPPLVYVTFVETMPRAHLILIALAPLIVLDAIFFAVFASGRLQTLMDLCASINTLGATGDVWIVLKLLGHDGRTWVRDTKTGVEVFDLPRAAG